MSDHVRPPWTAEQVDSLNAYQYAGVMHEFACPHHARKDHDRFGGTLVATVEGWQCPDCTYTQDWAHGWMADGRWRAML